MWSFPNTIPNLRLRKVSTEPNLCCTDLSDEDTGSSSSREEGLECPICWESFNIVENVPYVLWCGHSLCQNCVLGLQWAVLKLPAQKFKLPFVVSCPWCSLLSFRWIYRGTLKFPRKNYFILWMVESLNGERAKSSGSVFDDSQLAFSSRVSSLAGCSASNCSPRRAQPTQARRRLGSNFDDTSHLAGDINVERPQFSLHKSLDYFIHVVSKFPLVILFLVIIFFVIPGSVAILVLYLLVSVLLALPSFLVLYFGYPTLDWLLREIASLRSYDGKRYLRYSGCILYMGVYSYAKQERCDRNTFTLYQNFIPEIQLPRCNIRNLISFIYTMLISISFLYMLHTEV